jgi:hypothetical protein
MPRSKIQSTLDRYFTWRVGRLDRALLKLKKSFGPVASVHGALKNPIPIILVIDVEPDELFIGRNRPVPWKGYEHVYDFFRSLRPMLSDRTGAPVHYSWYFRMDPQIADVYGSPAWATTHYATFVDDCAANGDEIGLHPHDYRWEPQANNWIVDHGNQPWINHCVKMAFDTFREVFDRACDSFRFGDRWMNNETLTLVESHGSRFDLTLEPGRPGQLATHPDKPFSGALPDYTDVPRSPFRPSKLDFRKPGSGRTEGIWVIPMSTCLSCEDEMLSKFWGKIIGDETPTRSYHTLNMGHDPGFFPRGIDRLLCSASNPYLSFVIRSDIGSNRKLWENLQKNFDSVLTHPLVSRFVLSTPAETMKILGLLPSEDYATREA